MTEVDLKQVCEDLRSLGRAGPAPEARAILTEHLLRNKWEGVQSCAAQVLAEWGGRESVEALRAWLLSTYERKNGWAINGVAAMALARCVGDEDADWILDLYFGVRGWQRKHDLRPLVVALPFESVRDRFRREARSADRDNRQAVLKAIVYMSFPDRAAWLQRFAADPDSAIGKAARSWIGHESQARS